MLTREELEEHGYGQDEYLLATDTAVVVPVNKTVVVQVTGVDVIHAWTIPAFGVKQDAVPGRLAELWFKVEQRRHLFRPVFRALRQGPRLYADHRQGRSARRPTTHWLAKAIEEFAGGCRASVTGRVELTDPSGGPCRRGPRDSRR